MRGLGDEMMRGKLIQHFLALLSLKGEIQRGLPFALITNF